MLALGLIFFFLMLAILMLSARAQATVRRHRYLAIMLCIAYLGLLFLHPYLFGLPGRIAENRFQKELRPGMTRTEIIRLAQEYGGTGPFRQSLDATKSTWDWRSDGALHVWFTDSETFCIVGGNDYGFYFSPQWKLVEWKVQPWGNAC